MTMRLSPFSLNPFRILLLFSCYFPLALLFPPFGYIHTYIHGCLDNGPKCRGYYSVPIILRLFPRLGDALYSSEWCWKDMLSSRTTCPVHFSPDATSLDFFILILLSLVPTPLYLSFFSSIKVPHVHPLCPDLGAPSTHDLFSRP
jgi:hypothetical protein